MFTYDSAGDCVWIDKKGDVVWGSAWMDLPEEDLGKLIDAAEKEIPEGDDEEQERLQRIMCARSCRRDASPTRHGGPDAAALPKRQRGMHAATEGWD